MKLKKEMIRLNELTEHLNVSKSTLYRWRRTSDFPKPVAIGPRSIFFFVEEIEAWLEKREQLPY
jgi:prophage regulatory protein